MNTPTAQRNCRIATIRNFFSAVIVLIVWLGIAAITAADPAPAPTPTTSTPVPSESSEYAVKAAFLFKFGAYIEWPAGTFEDAKAPLIIGVVGDDPFDGILDSVVTGHTVDGRPVTVVRAQQIDQIKTVHILFISQSEKGKIGKIATSLEGKKVLTVSEFDDPNIIIQFVIETNKIRFDINLDQANRSGLKLSSKLLSVARNVKRK
jgi:hypothetical protein